MSISEQVKELRNFGNNRKLDVFGYDEIHKIMSQSADTIEALSAKLETANKELERWHTDKINDKIKNPFAWTSTLCCHNCDHKDEYIEELEAADMERPAEDCGGGWILCSTGNMPDMGSTVLIQLKSERDGITGDEDRTFDISFIRSRDNSEWISPSAKYPLKAVKAWKPIKAYHEP